jgi:hypothetical protein
MMKLIGAFLQLFVANALERISRVRVHACMRVLMYVYVCVRAYA